MGIAQEINEMDTRDLERIYEEIKDTEDVSKYMQFTKDLLASSEPEVIDYHFGLLARCKNARLRQHIRAAFVKRGKPAEGYLSQKMKTTQDPALQADILHMLGRLRSEASKPLAREFAAHGDPDHRNTACYVLGWVGEKQDIPLLRHLLLNDPDARVRRDAATAHDQFMIRLPDVRKDLLANLGDGLRSEKDEEVLAWIVMTLQYILKKKFGLQENIEEATWSGNVDLAKAKALHALEVLEAG
jgi:HEAT repeat protein